MRTKKLYISAMAIIISAIGIIQLKAQTIDKPAYNIFDKEGNKISFKTFIEGISKSDIVLFGEQHNCPISHWIELETLKALFSIHKDKLSVGAEMFETDNQLILDEYMSKKITYQRFEAEARLWGNYSTDYQPLVYFSKENNIPFFATNIPRRYANSVKEYGIEILDSLSDEAKRYIAPLPISMPSDTSKQSQMFDMMKMMGTHKESKSKGSIVHAQAVKDATMAWFIVKNIKSKFLHFNGNFHSDNYDGIIPYIRQYNPKLTFTTISTIRQEDISKLDEENKYRADYYICVVEDMTLSY